MQEPPKEHQFKPGQSGNPAGRAKGHKWLKTRLIEMMEATGADNDIVVALIEKAKKGDIMAIKEVMDRIDGKVVQEVESKTTVKDERIDLSKLSEDELDFLERIQHKGREGKEEVQ